MHHILIEAVAFLGAASVAISAFYWWRSSVIDVDPPAPRIRADIPILADGDYSGTVEALKKIGRLNKSAAMWSAISAGWFFLAVLL